MSKVTFMRHGKTDWNASGMFMSRTDLPLSPAGVLEAENAVPSLRLLAPDTVFSSPSVRARQTAQIAADGLGLSGFTVSDDLVEVDFGIFEGGTTQGLKDSPHALAFAAWQDPDSDTPGAPEGESWSAVSQRVARVLQMLQHADGHVLVVSHGYFIRAVLADALGGLHPRNLRRLELSNAGLSTISNDRGYWRIDAHNIT